MRPWLLGTLQHTQCKVGEVISLTGPDSVSEKKKKAFELTQSSSWDLCNLKSLSLSPREVGPVKGDSLTHLVSLVSWDQHSYDNTAHSCRSNWKSQPPCTSHDVRTCKALPAQGLLPHLSHTQRGLAGVCCSGDRALPMGQWFPRWIFRWQFSDCL